MSAAGKGMNSAQALSDEIRRCSAPTEPDNLSGSAPAANGVASTDTLADAHVELTRAFGLLLTMPEVELALRHSGQWYDARSMLFRHQELARARGAQ